MQEPDPLESAHDPATGVDELLARLIRYDTSNYGDERTVGERACAEYVAEVLTDAGLEPSIVESAPRRANVMVRIPGESPDVAPMLAHAHLDVVPASPAEWSVPPFAGEVRDGCVWGRGALDMKDMAAGLLAVVRSWTTRGVRPKRDLVLAFVADEEVDGEFGARYLVRERAEVFAGCAFAIGESGGHTHHVTGPPGPDGARSIRLYTIAAGERGSLHTRVTAHGVAGHGSRPNPENPVALLVSALSRVTAYAWPARLTPVVEAYLGGVGEALGVEVELDDPAGIDRTLERLGHAGELAQTLVRNTCTPTVLEAGYKVNVVPSTASALLDVRALPGTVPEVEATLDTLLGPGIAQERLYPTMPLEAPVDTPWFAAMADALRAEDPEAVVLPTLMGGGTDAKAFAELGIPGYGFAPLGMPADFPTAGLVHGVDERVPIEALRFGARVLDRFLLSV